MYLIFLHIVDKFVSVIIVFWKSYLNYCILREIQKIVMAVKEPPMLEDSIFENVIERMNHL